MTAALSSLIDDARHHRAEALRLGKRRSLLLAATVLLVWAVAVTATGQLDRIADNASAALTMVFGSFVAGSTPQGGGAVAFPVFTKLLGVTAADAKTFSLSIQAIGMGSASAIIAISGRAVDREALRRTVPGAVAGFLAGSLLFSYLSPPAAYLKVIFTLVVVAAGAATWLSRRRDVVEHLLVAPLQNRSVQHWVVLVSAAGGVASALFGSGADVAVYLLLTIVLGVRPGIGVATSVVTMAAVSVVGLFVALATGQLMVSPAVGDTDVFGMWLAAVPVVVIGAPVGSWCASRVSTSSLARFIAALAAVELVSTAFFLEELRADPFLAVFAAIGLAATSFGVWQLMELRDRVAATRRPRSGSIRRLDLDLDLDQNLSLEMGVI